MVKPSCTVSIVMISSVELPKVVFREPLMPGPVKRCLVSMPISQASGISASRGEDEQRRVAERS